mmetsp:Transcript_27437/g.38787  ORF Transcript_27437/g.38787 Transcript_27437/m.38787 type:complete len:139 (-) Transcript_27437:325-741(-)
MKSQTANSILKTYQKVHAHLCSAGLRPKLQRLDNECSEALKTYMKEEKVDYQLVPPHIHRRNAAERAIRTFKNHFIAGLCRANKNFPLHLWDKLIHHMSIDTMPQNEQYAPLKTTSLQDCAPHAIDGWYLGPALESYR